MAKSMNNVCMHVHGELYDLQAFTEYAKSTRYSTHYQHANLQYCTVVAAYLKCKSFFVDIFDFPFASRPHEHGIRVCMAVSMWGRSRSGEKSAQCSTCTLPKAEVEPSTSNKLPTLPH